MKHKCLFLCVVLSMPVVMGMGIMGDRSPRTKPPETPRQFSATITDAKGESIHVEQLSYDGELYVPVYKGKGLIIIPFEKIMAIEFGEQQEGKRRIHITFVDQKTETFLVEENILFVGKVPYGTYQIETKDMKRLELHHPAR